MYLFPKLYLGFAGAGGCLIATGFCDCEHRSLAVGLLSLAVMFTGVARPGYGVNHVDLAPKYVRLHSKIVAINACV